MSRGKEGKKIRRTLVRDWRARINPRPSTSSGRHINSPARQCREGPTAKEEESRRDGTIHSPARQCREGPTAKVEESRRDGTIHSRARECREGL
jgi:hypothetical protein